MRGSIPSYQPPEALSDKEYAQATLDTFFTVLDEERLVEPYRDMLGRLGLERVTNYVLDRKSYQAASAEEASAPGAWPDLHGTVPVFALEPYDKLMVTHRQHSLQRDVVVFDHRGKRELISNYNGTVAPASVWIDWQPQVSEYGDMRYVRSAPYLALTRYSGRQVCKTVMSHEIVHVAQMLDRPVVPITDAATAAYEFGATMLAEELEAYAVQCELYTAGLRRREWNTNAISAALAVNAVRKRTVGTGYVPTTAAIEGLLANSVTAQIIPNVLRDGLEAAASQIAE